MFEMLIMGVICGVLAVCSAGIIVVQNMSITELESCGVEF